jgi:GNAT superfamily N-acetyltransferase
MGGSEGLSYGLPVTATNDLEMTSERIGGLSIGLLDEEELPAADRILRDAFNTFVGVPDVFGDRDYLTTRFHATSATVLAAHVEGALAGTNVVTRWGRVGVFGPLSVRPDLWDAGIGRALVHATMALFREWGTTHEGLFTFPHSPKHIGLYGRFGFRPRFLTAIVAKPVGARPADVNVVRYSMTDRTERPAMLASAAALTSSIYEGWDLTGEIEAVEAQGLGDVLLSLERDVVDGLAVCHVGAGTEAGSGAAYVKVGMVAPGEKAGRRFANLLRGCEALAADRGVSRLELGVNLGCAEAHDALVEQGFRTRWHGIAMDRPNEAAFHDHDYFVVDDWR